MSNLHQLNTSLIGNIWMIKITFDTFCLLILCVCLLNQGILHDLITVFIENHMMILHMKY